jgi:DNA adenine methylase
MNPVLKWPGGKRWLIPNLLPLIPLQYGRYFEPFLGGGALFFALRPKRAQLSDTNAELISFYKTLKQNWRTVLSRTKEHKNDEATYYQMRSTEFGDEIDRAARFLYLNKTAFNGLHRTNSQGKFNVPFGNNRRSTVPAPGLAAGAARSLRSAKLLCLDFEVACENVERNDFVFFDPPYTVAHENNGFIKYNSSLFTWEDQERLRDCADILFRRRARFLITNAAHPSISLLYKGYKQLSTSRMSMLSADISARKKVNELIICNF